MSTVTMFILSTLIKHPIYTFYIHKISTGKIYKSTPPYQHNSSIKNPTQKLNSFATPPSLKFYPNILHPPIILHCQGQTMTYQKVQTVFPAPTYKYILLGINAYNTTVLLWYTKYIFTKLLPSYSLYELNVRREQKKTASCE